MYSFVEKLARYFAMLGGLVLSALILLTCISVVGRSLNSMIRSGGGSFEIPILDRLIEANFELVEAGMVFTIFAFLPLCQFTASHASVTIFTDRLSVRFNRGLRFFVELVFAATLVLIAWQLSSGMMSKYNTGQTTLLLQFPVWWAYAVSVVAAVVSALVGIYVAGIRLREIQTGQVILSEGLRTNH